MSDLGKLFSSDLEKNVNKLTALAASGIADPVGDTAFTVPALKVDAGSPTVKVFDTTADLGASASAQVSIGAAGAQIAPFDSASGMSAPAGNSYAQLQVTGSLSGSASETTPLTISASASASFTYQRFITAAATEQRTSALARALTGAQLPQYKAIGELAAGEVNTFNASLNVDLGIKAKYGSSFDVDSTIKLFEGLSAQFIAEAQYSIEASLGWSLFEQMTMAVGNAQQVNAGWTRVRISRTSTNTLTAGATFALQVNYDVSSLATALEKAFNMTPLPRVIDILAFTANTSFDTLKTMAISKASEQVIAAVAGTGWKQKAANDPTITKALADINKALSIYNGVDAKVKQLWNSLLTKVNLQPGSDLRKTIEAIAALDPKNPNLKQFLSPTTANDLELLETLSGVTIEQLLTGSGARVEIAISAAVNLAQQLLRVINDTPTEITGAISDFEQQFGIQKAVNFLASVSSLDKIEEFGDQAITKLVAKVVGVAFDQINTAQFDKVQAWAKKLLAQWDALSAKLTAAAKYLKGEVGFSVALEFSRASSYSALLDFEVNPAIPAAVSAVQAQLPSGSISGMLKALNGLDAATFDIRDAMIVSRHLRTGTTTVILSLLGLSSLQKVTTTRFDESVISVSNAGRQATYSGGFTQSVTATATGDCSAWIAADASDSQKDITAPFTNVGRSLHLTLSHHSMSSTATERSALSTLLSQLGFFPSTGAPGIDAADGAETIFAMNITLGDAAVSALVADLAESQWNNDFRNGSFRLLSDALFDTRKTAIVVDDETVGVAEAEASVVKTQLWSETWLDTSTQKFRLDPRSPKLDIKGKALNVVENATIQPPYLELQLLIANRPRGLSKLDVLQGAIAKSASGAPADLAKLASAAGAFFANTSLDISQNPMFNFWFVVARLVRLGATALANAQGLATLRVKPANGAFGTPQQWTLTQNAGVPVANVRPLFPFA